MASAILRSATRKKLTPSRFKKHFGRVELSLRFLPHFFAQKRKRGEKNEVDMSFKEVKQTTFGCNKHCHWISSWASRACDKKTSGRLTTHNGCYGEFLSIKYFRQISICYVNFKSWYNNCFLLFLISYSLVPKIEICFNTFRTKIP